MVFQEKQPTASKTTLNQTKQIIFSNYGIKYENIELLPEGFFQSSYVLTDNFGNKYFLKRLCFNNHPVSKKKYLASLPHLQRLSDCLDFIPSIKITLNQKLYVEQDDFVYLIQNYVDSTPSTVAIEEILPLLAKLHKVPIKPDSQIAEPANIAISEQRYLETKEFLESQDSRLIDLKNKYLPLINSRFQTLSLLSSKIIRKEQAYTHKDPLSNVIRGKNSYLYMIDWDDLTIGNIEADLWTLIGDTKKLNLYEGLSGTFLDKNICHYYALENFFLYFSTLAKTYNNTKESNKRKVITEIQTGIGGWFELVYHNF